MAIYRSKDLDAMECHAEGAKLADSVELSAALSVLRKVPGGEQVGKPWSHEAMGKPWETRFENQGSKHRWTKLWFMDIQFFLEDLMRIWVGVKFIGIQIWFRW